MPSSKVIEEKAAKAQLLAAGGMKQVDIARELSVSTRQIRRYLTMHLDSDMMPVGISPAVVEARTRYEMRSWNLIHKSLDQLEDAFESGDMKVGDLIKALGVLSDRAFRMTPPVTMTVTETISGEDACKGFVRLIDRSIEESGKTHIREWLEAEEKHKELSDTQDNGQEQMRT